MERAVLADGELRAAQDGEGRRYIEGYAAVYNSVSRPIGSGDTGKFREIIKPGFFDAALKAKPDISVRVQHVAGITTLGRTGNGTAIVNTDKRGLYYKVYVPDTQAGRDTYELVSKGILNGSSYAFSVAPGGDKWDFRQDPPLRELYQAENIFDVAPVDGPAYEATTVEARSDALASMSKARANGELETATLDTAEEARASAVEMPEPEARTLDNMSTFEVRDLVSKQILNARGKSVVEAEEERFDPKCAAQHIGMWCCKPDWLSQAVEQIKCGIWKAQKYEDDEYDLPYNTVGDGIAVINVNGPMMKGRSKYGGTSTVFSRHDLREASLDPDVKAVLVYFDTPGGTVAGTKDFADEVYRCNMRKPVYAYCADMTCSAGYWVASQARKVYANKTAEIGSIGCVARIEDSSAAATMAGIKVHVISTGTHKGAFAPGAPVLPEHLEELQSQVNEINDLFVKDIAHGRGLTEQYVRGMATGQTWLADNAKDLRLIDEILSFDEAVEDINMNLFLEKARRESQKA
jgi:HK97 family phage prohead protease